MESVDMAGVSEKITSFSTSFFSCEDKEKEIEGKLEFLREMTAGKRKDGVGKEFVLVYFGRRDKELKVRELAHF